MKKIKLQTAKGELRQNVSAMKDDNWMASHICQGYRRPHKILFQEGSQNE